MAAAVERLASGKQHRIDEQKADGYRMLWKIERGSSTVQQRKC